MSEKKMTKVYSSSKADYYYQSSGSHELYNKAIKYYHFTCVTER